MYLLKHIINIIKVSFWMWMVIIAAILCVTMNVICAITEYLVDKLDIFLNYAMDNIDLRW